MRTKLSVSGDFKKARASNGVILVNNPAKPTKRRTRIHLPKCPILKHIPGVQGTADNFPIKPDNGQEYWHYDSIDEAKADYDQAEPCRCMS